MKSRIFGAVYILFIIIVSSVRVSATTIDFESLPSGNCAFLGSSVSTQGFVFSKGPTTHGFWACDASDAEIKIGDNSTRALINANNISNPTMESASGITFSLLSFDAGSRMYPVDYRSESLLVTGIQDNGNIVTERFSFNGTAFDTFMLPSSFINLTSVSWLAETSLTREHVAFLFDNIVVTTVPTTVPTPADVWLFGFGLIVLAGFHYVRKFRFRGFRGQYTQFLDKLLKGERREKKEPGSIYSDSPNGNRGRTTFNCERFKQAREFTEPK